MKKRASRALYRVRSPRNSKRHESREVEAAGQWELPIAFGREQLTCSGGLELRRYFPARIFEAKSQMAELLDIAAEVFSAGNLHH